MNRKQKIALLCLTVAFSVGLTLIAAHGANGPNSIPNLALFQNPSGAVSTFTTAGSVDLTNPFFQSLGTNGRSCGSCHVAGDGWTVTPPHIQQRFDQTAGTDPIFRTNDGSNCDTVDTSTLAARRQAYSLLLSRGLIRVAIAVPASGEFEVVSVNNPYGCNNASTLSMYRRPLPSTNLRFLSTVMWDGRESTPPSTQKITFLTNPADLITDLKHQSVDATNGHAQGAVPLTAEQQQQIVDFEMAMSTAQAVDQAAGALDSNGATGGPQAVASQPFFIGINDPLGGNPHGTPFTSTIFTLFDSWVNSYASHNGQDRRASIARGQVLFNTRPITITDVPGLSEAIGSPFVGSCGTCHDSLNVGNHSVPAPLNIGVANLTNPLGVAYLPVITLRNKTTMEIVQTTDPGRAMITGKWADVGKFKGPILRGLASRAPYFHNGSAATLADVVNFYNIRFGMGLSAQDQADLVAFLSSL